MKRLILIFTLLLTISLSAQSWFLLVASGTSADVTAPAAPTSFTAELVNLDSNFTIPEDLVLEQNDRWLDIWGSDWVMQAIISSEKIAIYPNPLFDTTNATPSVGRFEIIYGDDFTGVANESPRAQQNSLSEEYGGFAFTYGKEFRISWDMFLPADFDVNESSYTRTNTILAQFRNLQDGPIFSFGIDSTFWYFSHLIQGYGNVFEKDSFALAAPDLGKWQHWEMGFLYDSTASGWVTLDQNGVEVFSNTGVRTYPSTGGDADETTFSLDIYTLYLGVTDSLEVYFDNIEMENVTDGVAMQTCTYGDEQDSVAHFVNLSWTNPVDADHDSTFLYSASTNNTLAATLLASLIESTTSYQDTLTTEVAKYYWAKASDVGDNLSDFTSVSADSLWYAPNVPTSLAVTGTVLNQLDLVWTSPVVTDSIAIYRSTVNTPGLEEKIGSSVGESYSDVGLAEGAIYYYWLKNYIRSIPSDFSSVAGDTVYSPEMLLVQIDRDMEVGVERITNGTFTSNVTGWSTSAVTLFWYNTDWNGTGLGAYLPIALDSCRVATTSNCSQATTLTDGAVYAFSLSYFIPSGNTTTDRLRIRLAGGSTQNLGYMATLDAWTAYKENALLTGSNTETRLYLYDGEDGTGNSVGDKVYFDNVSTRQIPSYVSGGNHTADSSSAFAQADTYSASITASAIGDSTTNFVYLPSGSFTAVTDGLDYRFTVYAYTATAGTILDFDLGDISLTNEVDDGGFTKLNFDFTATASTTGNITLHLNKAATVYIDEASLKEQ